jgi:hypothetical protein
MIKAHHVIAPDFVNDILSVLAARIVSVRDQFDRALSPAQILSCFVRSNHTKRIMWS